MFEYLHEFLALAFCCNYIKAARILNTSKASLSRHILQLEKEIGCTLFNRRPLSLTEQGVVFAEYAEKILTEYDRALEAVRCVGGRSGNSLAVALIESSGDPNTKIVFEAFSELRDAYPNLSTHLVSDPLRSLKEAVEDDKADVAVLHCLPDEIPPGFKCVPFLDSRYNIWIHKDNPLAKLSEVKVGNLASYYHLRSTDQQLSTLYDGVARALTNRGVVMGSRLKDNSAIDLIFNIQPDEVIFGYELVGGEPPFNGHAVARSLAGEGLAYRSYLYYRADPLKSLTKDFVEKCVFLASRSEE